MKKFQGQEDKIQRRWHNLVRAYETLTDNTKFKNYKEYGHPDGSLAIKAVELLLP